MRVCDMVAREAVALEAAATRRLVLERCAQRLEPATGRPAADILDALLAREQRGTTGFGGGTALPHGRIAGLVRPVLAVVRLAQPVDWQALDGAPVDIVLALMSGEADGAGHLKALAAASRLLRDRAFVAKLRGARDADALWALVGADSRAAA